VDPPPRGMDERMTAADRESAPSRQQMWDERHAARDPIEVPDPDPPLVEEMSPVPPGRALDLGTGDGHNAVWLAAHGWDVTAVDVSRLGLERARALADRAGVDVEWVLADLLAWTPQPRAFDLVCLFFIHLPPPERRVVYQRAAGSVAPGGTLLIVGHDRSNCGRGTSGPQDPTLLFTAGEVAADLARFTIVREGIVRREVDATGWRSAQ
jgi:SAM-dependent methyltransferase